MALFRVRATADILVNADNREALEECLEAASLDCPATAITRLIIKEIVEVDENETVKVGQSPIQK